MRLSVLFLGLLALSTIITSMAAWGITFGNSYSQVSGMASQFTTLARGSMACFGTFVDRLLGANAGLVDAVLAAQERSGLNRTGQTKAQLARTVGVLVNYTAESTAETQQQMDDAMATFGILMGTVVADFKGLASSYMTQVRAALAAKGSASVAATELAAAAAKRRLQQLVDLGVLDLSRTPTDPVGEQDCTLLGLLCDVASEFYYIPFSVTSATGRHYLCGSFDGAVVTTVSVANGLYNETRRVWYPYPLSFPSWARRTTKQRCLAENPVLIVTGRDCPLPQSCRCGADMRCSQWYTQFANATVASFTSGMYQDWMGIRLHNSMPLLNASTSPPTLLGVVDSSWLLSQAQLLLPAPPQVFQTTYMVLLLNDTNLTVVGNRFAASSSSCATNETAPGDPTMPTYSGLRSCDPRLRYLTQWVAANRSLDQPVTLEHAGILWDVSPVRTVATSYFFIAGNNKSEVNGRIDSSEARASSQLAATRAGLARSVAARGAAARAYVAAAGDQDLQSAQALQDSFLAEIQALEESSQASLSASQGLSSANAQQMTEAQIIAVEAQKSSVLATIWVTAGWTVVVVLCLLLAVLGISASATAQVTRQLACTIGLMEDVAELRVEGLAAPRRAGVQELARLQASFQVMVDRLAEYKSYIPAGVLERPSGARYTEVEETESEAEAAGGEAAERRPSHLSVPSAAARRPSHLSRVSRLSHDGLAVLPPARKPSGEVGPLAVSGRRPATRPVAVLAVNVVGFTDLFLEGDEAQCREAFNEYVTLVHTVASQSRGNVDFLAGDEVVVTFNAHVPCADPAEAAATAALDLRNQLLCQLGDRWKFRLGVSFGPMFATTVGYTKFKFMAAVGSSMKTATALSHVDRLENGAVVADSNLHERMKFLFSFRPLELLHLPWVKPLAKGNLTRQGVFLLEGKKVLQEDEWLYQVGDGTHSSDWEKTFKRLVAATSPVELEDVLEQYLQRYPQDDVALRLQERLPLWVPGAGIPL
eukprot:EG_transcript_1676